MIDFLRKRQNYTGDDQQLGQEIRLIQSTVLVQELKKLDPDNPLLKEFNLEQFAVKQKQLESNVDPIFNDSQQEAQATSTAQIEIRTDVVPTDDILKREQGFIPKVEEFMPIILFR